MKLVTLFLVALLAVFGVTIATDVASATDRTLDELTDAALAVGDDYVEVTPGERRLLESFRVRILTENDVDGCTACLSCGACWAANSCAYGNGCFLCCRRKRQLLEEGEHEEEQHSPLRGDA